MGKKLFILNVVEFYSSKVRELKLRLRLGIRQSNSPRGTVSPLKLKARIKIHIS